MEMNENIIEKNIMLKIKVGSFLYGTFLPDSDIDYSGVFIPDKEYVFGFKKIEEIDLSHVSKKENGKNDSDAIDYKLYELRKFIKLLVENNPNILEMIFVNKENIEYINKYGKILLENKNLFPHIGLYDKFSAYAHSQRHKMMIRSDNYHKLEKICEFFVDFIDKKTFNFLYELENINYLNDYLIFDDSNVYIGDIIVPKNLSINNCYKKIKRRYEKFSNRKELISKNGYDTKFAAHLIRLLLEGKELLQTEELKFPFNKERIDFLLDIRNGRYSIQEIIKFADEIEKENKEIIKETKLPKKIEINRIEKIVIDIFEDFYMLR